MALIYHFISFQCAINKLNLQSEDFASAAVASATKGDPPVFSKL